MLKILKVTGSSMHPTLESGAFVLLWQSPCLYHNYHNYHNQTAVYRHAPVADKGFTCNKTFIVNKMPLYKNKRCRPTFIKHIKHYFQCRLRLSLTEGDIVAVNHPKYGQIIKRVTTLSETAVYHTAGSSRHAQGTIDALRVAGDNKTASVSEAQIGWVQADEVLGKVIYVFKK